MENDFKCCKCMYFKKPELLAYHDNKRPVCSSCAERIVEAANKLMESAK